jgi:hypothetical protein
MAKSSTLTTCAFRFGAARTRTPAADHREALERIEVIGPRRERIRRVERVLHSKAAAKPQDRGELAPEVAGAAPDDLLQERIDAAGIAEGDSDVGVDGHEQRPLVAPCHDVREPPPKLQEVGATRGLVDRPQCGLDSGRADARIGLGAALCRRARRPEQGRGDRGGEKYGCGCP